MKIGPKQKAALHEARERYDSAWLAGATHLPNGDAVRWPSDNEPHDPDLEQANRNWEIALHTAGVYDEALRGVKALWRDRPSEDKDLLAIANEATLLAIAFDRQTLKAMHVCQSYEMRMALRSSALYAAQRKEDERAGAVRASQLLKEEAVKKAEEFDRVLTELQTMRQARKRTGRRKKGKGGREAFERKSEAIASVLKKMKNNPYLSLMKACTVVVQDMDLPVKWPALAKHVRACKRNKGAL